MNLQQIKNAITRGHIVCWLTNNNIVTKKDGKYIVYDELFGSTQDLVLRSSGLCGYEADFYILCSKNDDEPEQLVRACPQHARVSKLSHRHKPLS